MLDNLAVSVLRYEKVRTTEAKAKEVRGRVDHMIMLAKRGDLLGPPPPDLRHAG